MKLKMSNETKRTLVVVAFCILWVLAEVLIECVYKVEINDLFVILLGGILAAVVGKIVVP